MTALITGGDIANQNGGFMPRSRNYFTATVLFFFLAGLKPLTGQTIDPEFLVPEFFIGLAPSVVAATQGEETTLTITIRCNTSSFAALRDCTALPKFDLHFSEFPDGVSAQTAEGRIGDNTISINASSGARAGSFPVQVTVAAGTTTQAQTFVLRIRQAASVSPVETESREPVAVSAGPLLIWEHRLLVAKTPEDFNRRANALGQDSWELVSVIIRQNGRGAEWVGFFRRPKQ